VLAAGVFMPSAEAPVRDLWDLQPANRGWRPIDENGLSNVIIRFLRRELVGAAIFANREVEVSRRPGDQVGKRADNLIDTFRQRNGRRPFRFDRGGNLLGPIPDTQRAPPYCLDTRSDISILCSLDLL
jgi:hypothetical protein